MKNIGEQPVVPSKEEKQEKKTPALILGNEEIKIAKGNIRSFGGHDLANKIEMWQGNKMFDPQHLAYCFEAVEVLKIIHMGVMDEKFTQEIVHEFKKYAEEVSSSQFNESDHNNSIWQEHPEAAVEYYADWAASNIANKSRSEIQKTLENNSDLKNLYKETYNGDEEFSGVVERMVKLLESQIKENILTKLRMNIADKLGN